MRPRASRLNEENISVRSKPVSVILFCVWGDGSIPRLRNFAVLLCDSASEGRDRTGDDPDLFSSRPTRSDHARFHGLPRLRLVQNGVRRERTFSGSAPLPVTPPLLRRLRPPGLRQPATASHDELLLWAAATLCFFGFFRAGEITVPSVTAYDPAVHLSWGDVTISDDGRVLRVFLKRSKTDQYGRGVEVFIGSTADDLCPVKATRSYVTRRGVQSGPFFCLAGGEPLTKARFVALVRTSLAQAGVPIGGYSGHSFRIGAATTAAQAGIPDSVIQALGRWSSPAFLRYIRTPRSHLAQYSSSLARRS